MWRYFRRCPLAFVKEGERVYYPQADVRAFARTYQVGWKQRRGPHGAAWWTEKQVAAFLGIPRGTLAAWRRRRRYSLGDVKVDGRVRYARADVLAFGKAYAVLKCALERRRRLKGGPLAASRKFEGAVKSRETRLQAADFQGGRTVSGSPKSRMSRRVGAGKFSSY